MDRAVVIVGPLATANASNIALAQTPTGNTTVVLNGSTATATGNFTGNIAGSTFNLQVINSGGPPSIGSFLSAGNLATSTKVIGIGTLNGNGTGTYIVQPAQTLGNTTLYANAVATLDQPRQVQITAGSGNLSALTISLAGTDWSGMPISETIVGPAGNGTAASALSYATVTGLSLNGNATGNLTVGTNTVASSQWVRFDSWASPNISMASVVSAAGGNYTHQISMDNPDSTTTRTGVMLANMTWINSPIAALVGASTTQFGNYAFAPGWARVVLNSGNGTITTSFQQSGVVPY